MRNLLIRKLTLATATKRWVIKKNEANQFELGAP